MSTNEQQSRRAVLRVAAGAFSLAASGLFLPADLGEVEAREGALGGKHGGRRGKNRRGRNRAKRRQRRRERKRAKGLQGSQDPFDPRPVSIYVTNARGTPVTLELWAPIDNIDYTWALVSDPITLPADFPAGSGPSHDFDFVVDAAHLMLNIGDSHFFEFKNPRLGFPWVCLRTGSWIGNHWSPGGGHEVFRQGFAEWEYATIPGFIIQRMEDKDKRKRFLVKLI